MFKLINNSKEQTINTKPFITVAGNVGAGKSTLTTIVGERFGFNTHFEKVDGNPYLEDFYTDQSAYGFHLQLYFLAQRFKQQKDIDLNGESNIQDRSIYEDAEIFAKNLYENGIMSERDYTTYRDLFYDMIPHLRKPDLMIFLDGSIETILKRISLRGREMEQEVDTAYWQNLHNRYKEWIQNYTDSPVLYVNIDEVDLVDNPDHIDKLCKEISKALNIDPIK